MPSYSSLPNGGTLTYVTREGWEAGAHRAGAPMELDAALGLVVHHTPELPAAMKIQRPTDPRDLTDAVRYMDRLQEVRPDLNNEVPYSWAVLAGAGEWDAIVCEGRGPGRTGAHTAALNRERYGVALAQNTDDQPPTPGQIEAIKWIGREYIKTANPEPTGGHSDYAHLHRYNATECPGDNGRAILPLLQPPYTAGHDPETTPAGTTSGAVSLTDAMALRRGDYGPNVENWQKTLLELGFELPKFGADKDFGEETETATKAFEISIGLDDDGIVSVEQARLAMNAIAEQNRPQPATPKPLATPTPTPPRLAPQPTPPAINEAMLRDILAGVLEDADQVSKRVNAILKHLDEAS